ncbi:hypothetical protein EJB05_15287, partial [Eragrostis curvula]
MSFQRFPPPTDNCRSPPNDTFMLLSPTNSSESRILHVTEEGPGFLYDAGARSMSTVPSHNGPVGFDPLFISIAGTRNEKDSIYLLNPHPRHPSFEVLNFNDHPLKWQHLPLPPFFDKSWSHSLSFTDTRSQKWWQAGDWMMPFAGRAEYVPELNSWLGFSYCSRRSLCASSDLSAMDAHQRAPMLQHDWEDLTTPEEKEESVLNKRFRGAVLTQTTSWRTSSLPNLINLGGGRFCIAKFFEDVHTVRYYYEQDTETDVTFFVLTGVEFYFQEHAYAKKVRNMGRKLDVPALGALTSGHLNRRVVVAAAIPKKILSRWMTTLDGGLLSSASLPRAD